MLSSLLYSVLFIIALDSGDDAGGERVTSSLTAHIWKIKCAVGDIIQSAEDVLVVLEAMKTEVSIEAGEENVGRRVKGFAQDVKEGATIQAGDVLLYLE